MSNAVPSRLGQINGAGATDALFLKIYGGEVMTAFERSTVFRSRTLVRNIKGARSAQFPIVGRINAVAHVPGTEILGAIIPQNELVLTVDDVHVAPVFIADIDEAMNHYDLRGPYAEQTGASLARLYDERLAQTSILAARAAAPITDAAAQTGGGEGGAFFNDAAFATSGANLAAGLFDAGQVLDEKDVPATDRYAFVRPATYSLLAETTSLMNKDWGGSGTYADAVIPRVAGFEIVKTNSMPITNISTGPTKYQGNFTVTRVLCMHKGASGTVELIGVVNRMTYDPRRLGTLITSHMAVGHGILRPALAVELRTANP